MSVARCAYQVLAARFDAKLNPSRHPKTIRWNGPERTCRRTPQGRSAEPPARAEQLVRANRIPLDAAIATYLPSMTPRVGLEVVHGAVASLRLADVVGHGGGAVEVGDLTRLDVEHLEHHAGERQSGLNDGTLNRPVNAQQSLPLSHDDGGPSILREIQNVTKLSGTALHRFVDNGRVSNVLRIPAARFAWRVWDGLRIAPQRLSSPAFVHLPSRTAAAYLPPCQASIAAREANSQLCASSPSWPSAGNWFHFMKTWLRICSRIRTRLANARSIAPCARSSGDWPSTAGVPDFIRCFRDSVANDCSSCPSWCRALTIS